MTVFGLFVMLGIFPRFQYQTAQGEESAVRSMLKHSITCTWNKWQFRGEGRERQRPWAPVRRSTGCTGRSGEARGKLYFPFLLSSPTSFPALGMTFNFTHHRLFPPSSTYAISNSGCHRDAWGRQIPHGHGMNDGPVGRRQAGAVVRASCQPGPLWRALDPEASNAWTHWAERAMLQDRPRGLQLRSRSW